MFRDSKMEWRIIVLLLSLTFVAGCSKESPEKPKESATEAPETTKPTCSVGDIAIIDMFLPPADRMATAALYCTIENRGASSDSLIGVSSPMTDIVEIHETVEDGGMATTRTIEGGLAIPAKGSTALKLGGTHVLLVNITRPLKNGDSVEVEFRFARNGSVKCIGIVGSGPVKSATGGQAGSEGNALGEKVYRSYCQSCHQPDGKGIENIFPPLAGSDYLAKKDETIDAVVNGKQGPLMVNGKEYNSVMPPLAPAFDDEQAAAVINYVMGTFGNGAWSTTAEEVGKIRKK